jgi:hypothetical protein
MHVNRLDLYTASRPTRSPTGTVAWCARCAFHGRRGRTCVIVASRRPYRGTKRRLSGQPARWSGRSPPGRIVGSALRRATSIGPISRWLPGRSGSGTSRNRGTRRSWSTGIATTTVPRELDRTRDPRSTTPSRGNRSAGAAAWTCVAPRGPIPRAAGRAGSEARSRHHGAAAVWTMRGNIRRPRRPALAARSLGCCTEEAITQPP